MLETNCLLVSCLLASSALGFYLLKDNALPEDGYTGTPELASASAALQSARKVLG